MSGTASQPRLATTHIITLTGFLPGLCTSASTVLLVPRGQPPLGAGAISQQENSRVVTVRRTGGGPPPVASHSAFRPRSSHWGVRVWRCAKRCGSVASDSAMTVRSAAWSAARAHADAQRMMPRVANFIRHTDWVGENTVELMVVNTRHNCAAAGRTVSRDRVPRPCRLFRCRPCTAP